jgi:hypothetical protein
VKSEGCRECELERAGNEKEGVGVQKKGPRLGLAWLGALTSRQVETTMSLP